MKLALVRKEAREHWLVLALVLALDTLVLLGMLTREAHRGGRFGALVETVRTLGVLSALVVANRVFVREYAGRTQLFLEVLPIGRARVWLTKWLCGWCFLCALTVAAWFTTWMRALRTELISAHDALSVLLSIGSFMFVVWGFASMAGMLGRHRYTAWILLLCLIGLVIKRGKLAFAELPGMSLLGPDVAMARASLDWPALTAVWSLAAGFAATSATLALAGSGALASTLAQKMTARERVFLFVASLVGLVVYERVDAARSKLPFSVADALYAKSAQVKVGVLRRGEISDSDAQQLAQTIADDLESMRQWLGLDGVPPVFILPKRSLDPTFVERAALEENDGIVLRTAADVVRSQLRTRVLHDALVDQTRQRAVREDRHVLLDGFASWWALRANPREREQRWLRAAAAPTPLTASTLTRWEESQEHAGSCVSDGVALAVFDTLARQLSSEATQKLARSLFARPPDDFRVLFERSPAALLQQAGMTWSALAAATERQRLAVFKQHAAALAQVAQRSAALKVKQTPRQGTRIEVALAGAPAYWALYTVLGPWDGWQASLSRLDVRAARATLPLSAPARSRVLVALETDDAALACPVRVLSERITLP